MVVHEPGPWFDEVLDGLADQDYPNLRALFLTTDQGSDRDTVSARIRDRMPDAIVRPVDGNPGFAPAANEVLRLVEGDNGFFCVMHDDVALEPDAVRLLVEELYRSNAGIVGPKLTLWSDRGLLQHVGLGVDRFGEVDPLVERGEVDQEQHDAVRDVFALPSACMLLRADLFRALGGFDPTMAFHGEDIDLCWRAHLNGARVVVVPSARARHREALSERRPDLPHRAMQARHRMRSVATLTGARRLPGLSVELVLLTFVEMVVGVFTGRVREAGSSLRALFGLIPRTGQLLARRRRLAPLRRVPDREVHGLQVRGSARLASYLRSREYANLVVDHSGHAERRFTRGGVAPLIAWAAVLAAVLVGSRDIITGGAVHVGQFLPFPDSPRDLFGDYASGWWGHGLGATTAAPTGIALIGLLGAAMLGHMGLAHTVAIVGLLVAGVLGMWRAVAFFPSTRARIAGFLVYAAIPLPYAAVAVGRWDGLAVYAAAPWIVHGLRRFAAIEPSLQARAEDDVADEIAAASLRDRIRPLAVVAVVSAVVAAFVPSMVAVVAVIGVALALATILARGPWQAAAGLAAGGALAAIVAIVLNLPWIATLVGDGGMTAILGPAGAEAPDRGLLDIAVFGLDGRAISVLAAALYLPLLASSLLARGWRLTWAARGASLVVVFGALAVLSDTGKGPIRLPDASILLAPVACGLALCAAATMAAFEQDVRGGHFGWRQPLGILGAVAVAVSLVPGIVAAADGRWSMPKSSLVDGLALRADPPDGDYRVLFVGDPDLMPVAPWTLAGGMAYAVVDDGPITIAESWAGRPVAAEAAIADVLTSIADGATTRGGRLLAPLAIRYVVVPRIDGIVSTAQEPRPLPVGLEDALDDQLDLQRLFSAPSFVLYENAAAIPTRSLLSPVASAASREAGGEALARAALRGGTPLMIGAGDHERAVAPTPAGVVHVAVPFDERWRLTVDGTEAPARTAFGETLAFEVPTAGTAQLEYRTSASRTAAIVAQAVAWIAVLLLAGRHRWVGRLRARGRRTGVVDSSPVLDLDAPGARTPSSVEARS